jgi:glycerate kinase
VVAQYGILPDGSAVMEMASASGIELIAEDRLNPLEATTYGTGQLIRHLLDEGHTEIVMGIGGSATVDGGTGMAQALGYRFLDRDGLEITDCGGKILQRINRVDFSGAAEALGKAAIRVACDVNNPLTGENGAAAVFGPQKGATPERVAQLDAGLSRLMEVAGIEGQPGDGAAGGLGYGLRVFCRAEIVPGARLIAETVGLPAALEGADLLITGEGRTDSQTASGKLCSTLAGMARKQGTASLLVSGALQGERDFLLEMFDYAFSISAGPASLEACKAQAPDNLRFLIQNIMRLVKKG